MSSTALRLGTLAVLAAALTGCGTRSIGMMAAPQAYGLSAMAHPKDDPNAAHLQALVKSVLDGAFAALASNADANHDGALTASELQAAHVAPAAVSAFMQAFDTNKDGQVTASEYAAAEAAALPAFANLVVQAETRAAASSAKNFQVGSLRPFMTSIGMTGDWPLVFQIFKQLDLDGNQKLLSNANEVAAFQLFFARPQLQFLLGLPVGNGGDPTPAPSSF